MSDITKITKAGIDGLSANRCVMFTELFAGEALDKADACYIANDEKVYQATASGGLFNGFTNVAVASGQPVTLFGFGAIYDYGDELTPGDSYYLSATPGALATSGSVKVAKAISESEIFVVGF